MSEKPKKKPPTLTERVKKLESVVRGSESDWSLTEIQGILNKTDLTPEMKEQELLDLGARVKIIEDLIDHLGKSESHTGSQTLGTRLDIIEGNLEILHSSHLGHTNYAPAEFKQMHGFIPKEKDTDSEPEPATEFARLFTLAMNLMDLIKELKITEGPDACFAVHAVVTKIAETAGLEVLRK